MSDADLACIHELYYRSGEGYLACIPSPAYTLLARVSRASGPTASRNVSPSSSPHHSRRHRAQMKLTLEPVHDTRPWRVRRRFLGSARISRRFGKVRIRSIGDKPTCDPRRASTSPERSRLFFFSTALHALARSMFKYNNVTSNRAQNSSLLL